MGNVKNSSSTGAGSGGVTAGFVLVLLVWRPLLDPVESIAAPLMARQTRPRSNKPPDTVIQGALCHPGGQPLTPEKRLSQGG